MNYMSPPYQRTRRHESKTYSGTLISKATTRRIKQSLKSPRGLTTRGATGRCRSAPHTKKTVLDESHTQRPPDTLPDPWLFNSESLLRELDRCRELVLQIPIADHHATHFGINVAIDALWNLRETLRHLIRLHREGQRSFAKRAEHQQQSAKVAPEEIRAIRT